MFLAILGLLSGVLAGLAVGGGTLLVPGLVLIMKMEQHAAQGISLFVFLPTSVLAIITHLRYGNVDWRLGLKLIIGSALGAALGAMIALRLEAGLLKRIFAIYLIGMGIYQLLRRPSSEKGQKAKAPAHKK